MKLHGQFGRDTDDKKSGKSWHWLRYGNLKWETESLLSAGQEQTLNTNSVRKTHHKNVSNKCRLCGTHVENVVHRMSGCIILALCKNYGVKLLERWYKDKVESVTENDIVKIL